MANLARDLTSPRGQDSDPTVVGIQVTPKERVLGLYAQQQLAVTAIYSDGSTADATLHAQYESNDGELLSVSDRGRVETLASYGGGSVMVRYLGQLAVFRATIPTSLPTEEFSALGLGQRQ